MPEIKLTSRAYSKIILHAAKYPHCSISGVLLAKHLKGSKEEQKNRNLVILDAIPMFHLCLHVTPMTEIALTQVCFHFLFPIQLIGFRIILMFLF